MDPVDSILLDALRAAAGHADALRLYRSGKLPGLLPARTAAHAQAATEAVRDGLIEIVRTETRGKTTTEWVRVTPRGVDFVLQHDSPARAMDELRDTLQLNAQQLPVWVAELRQELDGLSRAHARRGGSADRPSASIGWQSTSRRCCPRPRPSGGRRRRRGRRRHSNTLRAAVA